jgi:hypothetical protein
MNEDTPALTHVLARKSDALIEHALSRGQRVRSREMEEGDIVSSQLALVVTAFFAKIDHGTNAMRAGKLRNILWREAAAHGKLVRKPA